MSSDYDPGEADVDMADNDENFEEELEAELEDALASNDEDDENDEEGDYYYGGGGKNEGQTFEGKPVEPPRADEPPYQDEPAYTDFEELEDHHKYPAEIIDESHISDAIHKQTEFEEPEDPHKMLAELEEGNRHLDAIHKQTESQLLDLLSQVPEEPEHPRSHPEHHHHIPAHITELVSPVSRVKELEEEVADLYYQIEGSGGFKEQIGNLENTIHREELSKLRVQLELMTRDRDNLRKELEEANAHGTEDPQIGYAFRSDGTYDFDFFSTPFPPDHENAGPNREDPNVILVSPRTISESKASQDEEFKELKEKYDALEGKYNDLVGGGSHPPSEDDHTKLKASEEIIKELQEDISFFAKQITESEAERMSLLGKAKEDSEQLAAWQQRLEDEAERSVELTKDYAHQITTKDAEIKKLTDEISGLKAQQELLVLSQQDFINQPQDSPDEKDHKIKEYEARIKDYEEKIKEYEQKIEHQKETIQSLTCSLSFLQDTLRESISTNSAPTQTFPTHRNALRDSVSTTQTPSPSTTDPESQSLHIQLLEKQQEISDLQEVKTSYSSLREVYHRDVSQQQSKIEEQKQQGKALVNELQRRLSESRRGKISLQDKILALGGSVDNPLIGTPAEKEDPMETTGPSKTQAKKEEVKKAEEELQKVRHENVNLLNTITGLNKVLQETTQEKDGLLEKLGGLSRRFDDIVKEDLARRKKSLDQEKAFEAESAKQKRIFDEKVRKMDAEIMKKERKKPSSSAPKSPTNEQTQKRIAELEAQNTSLLQQLAAQAPPILPPKKPQPQPKSKPKPPTRKAAPPKPRHPAQPPEPPTPRPMRSKRATRNPKPVYTYPAVAVLTGRVTKNTTKLREEEKGEVEALQKSPLEPELERDPDWREEKGRGVPVVDEGEGR